MIVWSGKSQIGVQEKEEGERKKGGEGFERMMEGNE